MNSLGMGPLNCILKPERNNELKLTVDVNSVHHKDVEDQQTQTERRMKF